MKQTNRKRSPFVMPEGYVEDFTLRMMQRIDAETQATQRARTAKPRGRIMQLYLRYAAGVAAAMALFMVCTQTASDRMLAGNGNTAQGAAVSEQKAIALTSSDQLYDYLMINGQTVYDYEANDE